MKSWYESWIARHHKENPKFNNLLFSNTFLHIAINVLMIHNQSC